MNTLDTKKTHSFRKIVRKEPDWMYNIRKKGWNSFSDHPLPDRVKNLWRYSKPEDFLLENYDNVMYTQPPVADLSKVKKAYNTETLSGYARNYKDLTTYTVLDHDLIDQGVIFKDLYTAAKDHVDLIGDHLGRLVGGNFGKFEALNSALWNSGFFLYIPDDLVIEKPFRLQREPAGPATFHRLLVISGRNSQATIIDDYYGDGEDEELLVNSVIEIFAGESSTLRYANLQRLGRRCKSYITQRTRIARNGQAAVILGGMGGGLSKVNAGAILDGPGAESKIYGVVFGEKDQHFDYHTLHHHKAGDTYSNIDFKVVLKDQSNSAYTGLIKINADARNCQAFQENRNLLLNQGPRAETIPELEILCDEVQCSHGATVGQIDPEMIFYLSSRGIGLEDAVKIIVSGFVEPTIGRLPGQLQDIARELIQSKLEGK